MPYPKMKLKLIEKKINFSIKGENFEAKVSSFMELTRCPETAIVIVRILNGEIQKGEMMTLVFNSGKEVNEIAFDLQINKKPVIYATKKQSIGIKLSMLTYQELKELNYQAAMIRQE